MSTFSALHLLRSYNHLFLPDFGAYGAVLPLVCPQHTINNSALTSSLQNTARDNSYSSKCEELKTLLSSREILAESAGANFKLDAFPLSTPLVQNISGPERIINTANLSCANINSGLNTNCPNSQFARSRGEKRPIPDEQKDERYFERRKRNNRAAKKSRDARKMREDQIALRATVLEHENAILRAQLATLRDEASNLRQLLLQRKQCTSDLVLNADRNVNQRSPIFNEASTVLVSNIMPDSSQN